MKTNVFISSGAFQTHDLDAILGVCRQRQLKGLELGSRIAFSEDMFSRLKTFLGAGDTELLIHNYFPPPAEPFVLNLASDDPAVLARSREHCLEALQWCARFRVPFYSVHAGFCFHASPEDLGGDLTGLPRILKDKAEAVFVESLKELARAAAVEGIDILVENNVLTPSNCVNGANDLMLGVTSDDLLRILEGAGGSHLGILLDVGHLKISAGSLGFSAEEFIRDLGPYVRAVHMSENNGRQDTHRPVAEDSWFWPFVLEGLPSCEAYVLEACGLTEDVMVEQEKLIHNKVKECRHCS